MLKQTITYTDFNDVDHTEDFYFNLTKRELAEMEVVSGGTYQAYLQDIIASNDNRKILETFKDILKRSFGIRSEDGSLFQKSEEATAAFADSGAMDALLMQFFQDATLAGTFVTNILPADLQGANAAAQDGFRPGADTTPPAPPVVASGTPPVDDVPTPVVPEAPVADPVTPVEVTPVVPVVPDPPVAPAEGTTDPTTPATAPVDVVPDPVSAVHTITAPVTVVDTTPVASAPVEVAPDPVQASDPVDATPPPVNVQTELTDPTWPVDNVVVSTDPADATPIDQPVEAPPAVDPSVTVDTDTINNPVPAVDPDAPVAATDPRLVSDLPTPDPGAGSTSGSPLFDSLSSDSGITPSQIEPDATQQ